MKYRKLFLSYMTGLMFAVAFISSTLTPIYAKDSQDEIIKEGQLYVENMKDRVDNMFTDLKTQYDKMWNNYGKLEVPEIEKNLNNDAYNQYLSTINKNREELNIDEKLENIMSTDLSVDNSDMKKEYENAKKQVASNLKKEQMNSNTLTKKFEGIMSEQNEQKSKIEKERIENANKKYSNVAKNYKEYLNKKPEELLKKPEGFSSEYSDERLRKVAKSIGIDYDLIRYKSGLPTEGKITVNILEGLKKTGKSLLFD